MDFTGKILNISKDLLTGKWNITLQVNEKPTEAMQKLMESNLLTIVFKIFRKKRSLDANGLFWHCVGELAKSQNPPLSKWEMYLRVLKDYGYYTTIKVRKDALEMTKRQWRETEVVAEYEDEVDLLCYFGSSTYDTKEFSVLLDGVIADMKDAGLQPPTSKDMQRALEQWEKMQKWNQ